MSQKKKIKKEHRRKVREERIKQKCLKCGKSMKQQVDPIIKKLSPYLWRCEECTPPGWVISIG